MIRVNGKTLEYDYNIISKAVEILNNELGQVDEYGELQTSLSYDAINDMCNKLSNEQVKIDLLLKLKNDCDDKSTHAKQFIGGVYVDASQVERYFDKYDMAVAYKEDGSYSELLEPEAKDNDVTVDEFADIIIKLHKVYKDNQRKYNSYIELYRTRVKRLIEEGLYDIANTKIEEASKCDMFKTIEEVNSIIS